MRFLTMILLLVATGCQNAAPGPQETLRSYIEAASQQDCRSTYDLMSDDFRSETTEEQFCEAMADNSAEFREAVASLRQVTGEPEMVARVRYGLGDEVSFVFEDGRWRIDTAMLNFYSQATPRDALRSFVRAIERGRYDVILRFVPSEYRDRMSADGLRELWEGDKREEIQQLLENLRASLDEPIEETGDRATMQYMERYTCLFIREEGLWRIEDPD